LFLSFNNYGHFGKHIFLLGLIGELIGDQIKDVT